ncbi:MAG TPA: thiamine pyrophosphate-dependent enzyme [Limnochordales bacterium]
MSLWGGEAQELQGLPEPRYGSDLIVALLRLLGIEYVALNPGATFRGLHDSLVNYGGGVPGLVLCTHEEIAVAVAHGYARVTRRPMAALVHDVVGLQHASMAIFNAWCDREPVLVLGGTGPMDSTRRRPWIDWVHTALVQGNLVRDFVKWDDQPASPQAAVEALLRAYRLAVTEPKGPVYVCFDVELQEQPLAEPVRLPADPAGFGPPRPVRANGQDVEEAARLLAQARFPVVVADFAGRSPQAPGLIARLAELLGAPVLDAGGRFNIPNTHPLDLTGAEPEVLEQADVVLALDVPDLLKVLGRVDRATRRTQLLVPEGCRIIWVGLNELSVRGWCSDFYLPLPVALSVLASPQAFLNDLLDAIQQQPEMRERQEQRSDRARELALRHHQLRARWLELARSSPIEPITPPRLAVEVWEAIRSTDWTLACGSLYGWARRIWEWEKPERYGGSQDPGGGLGFGLGASVGAALALKGTGRVVVDLQPDGDFLYTPGALWTAAHLRLPLLVVTVNNRSYFNDERHQEAVARARGRPVEARTVAISLDDPAPDLAQVARGMGVWGEGPVRSTEHLRRALAEALRVVQQGYPALVDVVVEMER